MLTTHAVPARVLVEVASADDAAASLLYLLHEGEGIAYAGERGAVVGVDAVAAQVPTDFPTAYTGSDLAAFGRLTI
jgi:hypothetical protein